MTILLFTYEYAHEKTPFYGGIGTYFKTIAHELSNRDVEVLVFVYGSEKSNLKMSSFRDGDIKVQVLRNYSKNNFFYRKLKQISKKTPFFKFNLFLKSIEYKYVAKNLLDFISNKKIDLIQSHDYRGPLSYVSTEIPKVVRCSGSTVMLIHEFNYDRISYDYDIMKVFEQKGLNNANYITAVSNFSAQATKKLFNLSTIDVINNGIFIDVNEVKNTEKIPFSIFYFGTVRETKGIDTLVSVFNQVFKKEKRATLHVIGKGKDYWNEISSNLLNSEAKKNAFYYGSKSREELMKLIPKATLFVFPTHGENFPFVFIEAMALGKPIIVNNIAVADEIITNTRDGYIVEEEEEYVRIILDLFRNPEKCNEIGDNARKKVLTNFTKKMMVDKTIQLYESIINT